MKLPHVCLTLAFTLAAPALAEQKPAGLDAVAFADALEACALATHQGPHPFVGGFVVEHAVVADTEAGCAYTQSMPGDMNMACVLSESGRAGLAAEIRAYAEGKLSGSSSNPPDWAAECEIVTKDGKRLPMHGG